MDYIYLERLKKHPAWRLLSADSAPLIVSFLDQAFLESNARSYPQTLLVSRLDDYLFRLNEQIGNKYPRTAHEYLDEWARGENAYLRKYYPAKGDEPEFDLTPATEKAIEWLRSLEQKPFVGTESRLLSIFQLLREVIQSTETDPAARLAALEKRKAELEEEIRNLRAGRPVSYDPTQVKERYLQIEDSARRLLADFRQVEENFRQLDRSARETIAVSDKSKGQLLDDIFGKEDAIASSDEGRSFRAFWEFLMSPARQDELQEMARKLVALEEVKALSPDDLLVRFKYRLMDAGEKVRKTSASLAEHLRRFLEGQAWLENRRIMEFIRSIEKQAVELKTSPPRDSAFTRIDDVRPDLDLTMARGLFDQSKHGKTLLENVQVIEGEGNFESDALYDIHFVDEVELRRRLDEALGEDSQITLGDVCTLFPLEKGLSELLTYLNIGAKDDKVLIDDDFRQTVSWRDPQGREKSADIPRVIFVREKAYDDA
ncbi:MAG: DUF3375 domain-containing protein [Elusimicrobiota bacterium]